MLSIIIVNYNGAGLVADCIRTLYQYNDISDMEIIVVDNGSTDNSLEKIMQSFPAVHWIDMGYNAGFARGNNAGIKLANGDVILLLNPDTLSIDDSVNRCHYALQQSEYVAAGVQLLDEHK